MVSEASRIMEIRQFRYFVQVIEAKSFTRAAEVLRVAQPALSHQILKLEAELGQKLLVRHSRGVEPTAAGERLLACARGVLHTMDRVRQDLQETPEEPHGVVRLGLPYSLSNSLAIELLQDCRTLYPKISLGIAENLSGYLTELLATGRLDLALTYSADYFDVVNYTPILQERLCFIEYDEHPGESHGEISFAEAAERRLILPSLPHLSRKLTEDMAKYCGLRLHIVYEVDALPVTMEMVGRNLGATIQPFLAVQRAMASHPVSVKAITRPEIARRLHLATNAAGPLSASAGLVKDLLLTHLRRFASKNMLSELVQIELEADSSARQSVVD